MNSQQQTESQRGLLPKQDRHQLVQQYRNALHLHGDPSQSDNVSDDEMLWSISQAMSMPALPGLR